MLDFDGIIDGFLQGAPTQSLADAKLGLVRLYYERICGRSMKDRTTVTGADIENIKYWYSEQFPEEDGKDTGVDRTVARDAASYSFDNHLNTKSIDNVFKKNDRPSVDTVLHLLVAMRATVEECSRILNAFGYARLHSRNVHHLAIYSVLLERSRGMLNDNDLFPYIRSRYIKALDIIGKTSRKKTPTDAGLDTLFLDKQLQSWTSGSTSEFESFISSYSGLLNWQHNRLLAEHFKLANLFSCLLDGSIWKSRGDADGDEGKFRLEDFIYRFCKKIEHKHYSQYLFDNIYSKGKHPTREIMIILWLFKYCFAAMPIIKCPRAYLVRLEKTRAKIQSGSYCPKTESESYERFLVRGVNGTPTTVTDSDGREYYLFDVFRYLFGKSSTGEVGVWDGSRAVAGINENLEKYGWKPLSDNSRFDYVFKLLESVTTDGCRMSIRAARQSVTVDLFDMNIDDTIIPYPLVACYLIFEELARSCEEPLLACTTYSVEI